MLRFAARIASTASPSEAPGARLKEMVAAGNWPRWLTSSGAGFSLTRATDDSGTCPPPVAGDVDVVQRRRALLELGLHLEHHAVLVGLGEDGRDQALAEGVVERVVDRAPG